MNKNKRHLFVCLVFALISSFSSYAQKINGTVTNKGKTVSSANVLLMNEQEEILQYTFTDKKGKYSFFLKSPMKDSLVIKVNSISFEPQTKTIKQTPSSQNLVIDFQMEERTTHLKEVLIKARRPIQRRSDTITYNMEAFMDGSERVVEDLLKKLPGIKVEENGVIKFNGKRIQTMLLGGDDLFSGQYTIGSKNIDINIVDSIQAIEHYVENPLLKGLVDSDEVALNLVLKKGKTDFSGNATLGYGYRDKYVADMKGLLVNKKSKGFLLASYNNIGENHTPFTGGSGPIGSVGTFEDRDLKAPTLIQRGSFRSPLQNQYVRRNSTFYSSLNFMHEFFPDFTAKINIDFYDDQLKRTNTSEFHYYIDDDTLRVNEINRMQKHPRTYNAKVHLSDKRNPDFIWEYDGKLNYHEGDYANLSSKNDLLQNNQVSTISFFSKQTAGFTYRKKENRALEGNVLYANSRSPQYFSLTPGVNYLDAKPIPESNFQSSRFDRETFKLALKYYQKYDNFKWNITGGYHLQNEQLHSSLSQGFSDSLIAVGKHYQNALVFNNSFPFLKADLTYKANEHHKFKVAGNVRFYDFELTDDLHQLALNYQHFAVNPAFHYTYSLTRKSTINGTYSYTENAPQTRFLYRGIVLTGYRSLRNNEPRFKFLKTHRYGITFNYRNFFDLTKLSVGIHANNRENNYYFRLSIDQDKIITTAFLLETGNKDYRVHVDSERYFHFMRTTLSLNGGYTWSFDKNLINQSDLRNIARETLTLNIGFSTGFDRPLNFYGEIDFHKSIYFLENKEQHKFRNLSGALTAVYHPSRSWNFSTSVKYLSPDLLKQNKDYVFLDLELRFKPKESLFEYTIVGRNLTGIDAFETIAYSDFYTASSSYSLQDTSVMLKVKYYF